MPHRSRGMSPDGSGTPLIVPTFVKTSVNLAEMDAWYDHWLRALGTAVITGPSVFAGKIPQTAVAEMEPPMRRACARLSSRMAILSDGQIVSCEQDILAEQSLARIGESSIQSIWTGPMNSLARDHAKGNWQRYKLCAGCREWHRP